MTKMPGDAGRRLPRFGGLAAGAAMAALALITAPPPAFAQDSASPPAAEATIDPHRLALARELFAAMHLDTAMRGMFDNVFKSMAPPMGDGPAEKKAHRVMQSFSTAFEASFPQLIDGMASVYARNLTTQELEDSLTFYQSPSGQAILNKMPVLMREAMPTTMKLMPTIAAAAEADFCAHDTCTEADHAVFKRLEGLGARAPAS